MLGQAETEDDSGLQPKLTTSCPNNAKPHVDGSAFVCPRFLLIS